MSLLRQAIAAMSGYAPGEQPAAEGVIKLNTNENPYPPSPLVLEAIARECRDFGRRLRLYPHPLGGEFRQQAAAVYGFAEEEVLCGNGSDDLLTMIVRAFCEAGDVVVCPYPTYTLYETLAQIQGAKMRWVDFSEDYSFPAGLAETPGRVLFIANPNSPSGTARPPVEIAALAETFPGLVVIDEAYADFAPCHCLDLVRKYRNVIVLRSLSKSFSLAGMRLGLAFADRELIAGLAKVKDSYNLDRLAIAAGAAALADLPHLRENRQKILATRAHLTTELEKRQWRVLPSAANFVLARTPAADSARPLYERLKAKNILVRYFEARHLDDCLRITVGTDAEIQKLLGELPP